MSPFGLILFLLFFGPTSWADFTCYGLFRPAFKQQPEAFHISGLVIEPIWPRSSWGPQDQYRSAVRYETAMVFDGLRNGLESLNSQEGAFSGGLLNYVDSPGSGMMAHLQIGRFYLDYLTGLHRLTDLYQYTMSEQSAEILGMHSVAQASTFLSRTAGLSIWSERGPEAELVGFVRVFDGTDYRGLDMGSWKETYAPTLPVEYSLINRDIHTNYFRNLRKEKFHIFEVGKYFIHPDLVAKNKVLVRRILHRFLRENFLTSGSLIFKDRVKFIFHLSSEVHRKAYEKSYHARVIDDGDLQKVLKPGEFIMEVDLTDFLNALSR